MRIITIGCEYKGVTALLEGRDLDWLVKELRRNTLHLDLRD